MSKEIHLSEIETQIATKIDISATNQIKVSFQLDAKTHSTEPVAYAEEKPIVWSNTIKIPLANDQSIDIKLYNDNVLLAKGIFNVPSTLEEQKNTLELLSQNKQLIAKISFKSNVQEIAELPKVTQQPQVKNKTQKIIPLQQSPQKSQKSIKSNKDDQPEPEPEPVENTLQKSVQKPSQKSIHQSQKTQEKPQQEQKISPKKSQIKLSDRPVRKLTQKSQKKPSQKPSQKEIEEQKPHKVQLQTSNMHESSLTGTQSLNKSRDTLKLPNIGDVSKNFGDRIYDKQSSATLQKSILVFSVPKAPRFGSGPKYAGEPSYYVDSCFKPNSTKGVGFGFGNKRQFPEWMQKNMKENPAPGAYFYQTKSSNSMQKKGNLTSHLHTRGPSFGISYKFYEKVTIPKEKSPQKTTVSNQRLKPIFRSN